MRIYAQQHDTVDAIAWRHYRQTGGIVETILDSNPGLAAAGPLLPHGYPVDLPDVTPAVQTRQLIQLWD